MSNGTPHEFWIRRSSIYHDGQRIKAWKIWPSVLKVKAGESITVTVYPDLAYRGSYPTIKFENLPEFVQSSDSKEGSSILKVGSAPSGRHFEFEVYVDGEYVLATSSPGVIIE